MRQEEEAAEELRMDSPKIIYSSSPAELILLDGDPVLRRIENMDLIRVVNTPYLLVFDPVSKSYFLNASLRPVPYQNAVRRDGRIHALATLPAAPADGPSQLPAENLYARAENVQHLARDERFPSPTRLPAVPENRRNDVFGDSEGGIYRYTLNGWLRKVHEGWRPENLPSVGDTPAVRPQPGMPAPPSQPSTRPSQPATRLAQPSVRPSQPSSRPAEPSVRPSAPSSLARPSIGNLNLERQARDRGAARTQIHRCSQPTATPRIRR